MKTFLLTIIVAVAILAMPHETLSQQPSSQTLFPWQTQSPLPAPNVLRKASFLNERVGWAVGSDSLLLRTSNGGASWDIVQTGVLPRTGQFVQFFDVRAVSDQIIWAMANTGTVITTDGGRTWRYGTDGGNSIFALSERVAWVIDDNSSSGIVLRSSNGGRTWQTAMVQGIRLREAFFLDSLRGWAVGSEGIAATTDGGATWTTILQPNATTLGGSTRFTDVWREQGGNVAVVVAEDSTILRTSNGGTSWERASLPTSSFTDITRLRMLNGQTGFALAEGNIVLATTDSGRTWLQRSVVPASTIVTDVQFVSEQVGYAVGGISFDIQESSVWKTSDGGRTWTQIRGTKNMPLYGLAVRTATDVTAVGNITILNTSNGGLLWATQLPLPGNADNFAKLYRSTVFLNPNLGYIVGEVGRILKTSDGGRTWTQPVASRNAGNDWYDVSFANDTTGWTVGANTSSSTFQGNRTFFATPIISRTTDGGRTWTAQTLPRTTAVQDTLQSVHAVSGLVAFAVGNQGAIYATRDGGAAWARQTSPTRSNLYGVFFLNENLGWAVGGTSESAVILQTTDGGATWRRQLAPADGALRCVFFVNAQQGYAVGNGGIILATRNGGATWEAQESRITADLYNIAFASPVRGYITGNDGVILATNNGGYTPQARTNTTVLDFGAVSVRDNATRTFTISAEHLLESLTITAPAGFTLDYGSLRNQSQISLSPNALAATQATLTVRFQPTVDGAVTSLLRISSAYISTTLALTGTGINRPVLRFSPDNIKFDGVLVGQSTQATLQVTNIGTTSGTIAYTVIPLDTARNPVFRLPVFVRAPEIPASASGQVPIGFVPRTFGDVSATLLVRVVQGNFDTTYAVRMTGTGLQAVLRPSASVLEFGASSLGQETSATLGITSVGNIPATVRRLSIEPPGAFVLRTNAAQLQNFRLSPQEFLLLPMGFIPQTLGFTRATLRVESDAGEIRIELRGNGIPLLAAPELVSPFNGRINMPVSSIFSWKSVNDTATYDMQISRDSTFRTVDVERTSERSVAFSPTSVLLSNTIYYWRVKSRTGTASSDWSPVWMFETVRSTQRITNSPEAVRISGYVGQTQRGVFTVQSKTKTTISRAFWQAGSDAAFSIRQDQFPLDLRSSVTEFITFDFTPRTVSSDIRGILVLVSPLDTQKVQILGEGIERDSASIFTKVAVQTDRTNATAGDTLKIRVMLTESRNLNTQRNRNKAQTFSALLKIRNETVLAAASALTFPPELSNNVFLGNGGKTIELRDIPRTNGMETGVLAEIPAQALLGNATSTVIEFLAFQWNDASEQRIVQSVVDSSVAFVSCTAGGTRLVKVRDGNSLAALAPNPAQDHVAVKFTLLETGQTSLYLVNVLGQRVRTYLDGETEWGEHAQTLDLTGLPDGAYTLVLQTPSGILQQRIGVLK